MPILTYLKLGGGLVLALALSFGVYWLKGRIDVASHAEAIEAKAAQDVATAKGKLEIAYAQIAADRASIAEAETARAAADETIRQREVDNATLSALLRARAKAVSAPRGSCDYRLGAHGVLADAWRGHSPADAAAVPDPAQPPH